MPHLLISCNCKFSFIFFVSGYKDLLIIIIIIYIYIFFFLEFVYLIQKDEHFALAESLAGGGITHALSWEKPYPVVSEDAGTGLREQGSLRVDERE